MSSLITLEVAQHYVIDYHYMFAKSINEDFTQLNGLDVDT